MCVLFNLTQLTQIDRSRRRATAAHACHNMHKIGEDANRFDVGLTLDQPLTARPHPSW
jgi:hypothetical protein